MLPIRRLPTRGLAGVALATGLITGSAWSVQPVAAHASERAAVDHPPASRPSRHHDAVTEAKRLLGLSPKTAGEHRVATAPVKRLRKAPQNPEEDQLVTRARFWTSSSSLDATFTALRAAVPAGTVDGGEGATGTIGQPVSIRYVVFEVTHPPGGVASAELIIAVVHDGHGHSAVGAYAQTVPQPRRRANEHVPLGLRTVHLVKSTGFPGRVLERRTVHGDRARALVRDFDALKVQPFGAMSCPADTGAYTEAIFRSHGHTWSASYPSCVSVARHGDGGQQPGVCARAAGRPAVTAAR
jgi:hypothetical protein